MLAKGFLSLNEGVMRKIYNLVETRIGQVICAVDIDDSLLADETVVSDGGDFTPLGSGGKNYTVREFDMLKEWVGRVSRIAEQLARPTTILDIENVGRDRMMMAAARVLVDVDSKVKVTFIESRDDLIDLIKADGGNGVIGEKAKTYDLSPMVCLESAPAVDGAAIIASQEVVNPQEVE